MFCAFANAHDEDTCGHWIQRTSMTNFDLYALVSSSFALILAFAFSNGSFSCDQWREEAGGVEMFLEVADDLGGRDRWWFIDGLHR